MDVQTKSLKVEGTFEIIVYSVLYIHCWLLSLRSLFVEKLPSHRDYQQCNVPEKQVIMKVSPWQPALGDGARWHWAQCKSS